MSEALEALRDLTTCRCLPAWTERGRHAPVCVAEYRDDVDALAGLLAAMQPVVEAARAWRAVMRLVEELQPGPLSKPGQVLAAAVDALDGAS